VASVSWALDLLVLSSHISISGCKIIVFSTCSLMSASQCRMMKKEAKTRKEQNLQQKNKTTPLTSHKASADCEKG
jgi:hypothetical protein